MRHRVVLFAIDGLKRACRAAEPKCLETLRITDRPAAHTGVQVHKSDGKRRDERRATLAAYPSDYEVTRDLPPAAEPGIA